MPQVPFERGGTEIFADGLVQALREHGHETELVTVPFKWYPGERVLTQAFLWRLLDLEEANGRPIDAGDRDEVPVVRRRASEQGRLAAAPVPPGLRPRPHRARTVLRVGGGSCAAAEGARARPRRARRGAEDLHDVVDRRRPAARLDRARGRGARAAAGAARVSHASAYEDFVLSVNRLDRAKRIDLLIEAAARGAGVRDRDRRRRARPRAARAARARPRARRTRDVRRPRQPTTSSPISTRAASASTTRRSTRTSGSCPYEAFLSEKPVRDDDRRGRPARHRPRSRDRARRRSRRATALARRCAWLARPRGRGAHARARRASDVARAVTWDACIERLLAAVA